MYIHSFRTISLWCLILFGVWQTIFPVSGQNYVEHIPRLGQNGPFGSVRSMGMGGIQMGTGAEGSALAVNPAAPGLLRKSDLQVSLMPYLHTSDNTFRGSAVSADRSGMPIGNFSLSLTNLKSETEGGDFRAGVFTVSYNRQAVYNYRANWEGNVPAVRQAGVYLPNSIIDNYLDGSNRPGYFPNDLLSANPDQQLFFNDNFKNDLVMAYEAYILDTANGKFVSAYPRSDLQKSGYHAQKLNHGVWNFGYSVNYKDKLFLGFSFEHNRADYTGETQYAEEIRNVLVDPSNSNYNYFQGFTGVNFQMYRNQSLRKRGVSGNLGLIYKLSDAFRISAAYQLPSLNWITEKYSPRITVQYLNLPFWGNTNENLQFYDVKWTENEFSYKMRLPGKLRAGLTWLAGKSGMAGLEIEYCDWSKARLYEGDRSYNFPTENAQIRNQFQGMLQIKAGGEIRHQDLRFRAGFTLIPENMVKNSEAPDFMHRGEKYFTLGIGARFEEWYWDAGLVLGSFSTRFQTNPYLNETVESDIRLSQLRLGIGFKL
jgi:hypothetical protein